MIHILLLSAQLLGGHPALAQPSTPTGGVTVETPDHVRKYRKHDRLLGGEKTSIKTDKGKYKEITRKNGSIKKESADVKGEHGFTKVTKTYNKKGDLKQVKGNAGQPGLLNYHQRVKLKCNSGHTNHDDAKLCADAEQHLYDTTGAPAGKPQTR